MESRLSGSEQRRFALGGSAPRAADLVSAARERERTGCIPEAVECYEEAVRAAEAADERGPLAEALRRLAKLRHQRDARDVAHQLCERSHQVALTANNGVLAGEALNTLGVMFIREGRLGDAAQAFARALAYGSTSHDLRARIEQNLGVVANIRGDYDEALARYARSYDAYRRLDDQHGCAQSLHNLGMVSAQRGDGADADRYFCESLAIVEAAGDLGLSALCMLNRADQVLVARQQYEEARKSAEGALAIFDQIDDHAAKASAYRVIGIIFRETGRPVLAESRLRSAIALAIEAGSTLHEAEGNRELAVLYQTMGRNQEALRLLNTAHRLFKRLEAQRDLIHVTGKLEALENTYLDVVRDWGQSIESSDSYTYGHCERVALNAVMVAQTLGLDEHEQKLIRLGAYLHDVGKVRVPHEILNKPGRLTREEMDIIQMHPVWGIELLAGVEFPWDLKPIIRWHHEKYDGTGYPDRLQGDEIPLAAQVVGIVDVYDALTTTRAYRRALSHDVAVEEITRMRNSWSPRVFDAFAGSLAVAAAIPATEIMQTGSAAA